MLDVLKREDHPHLRIPFVRSGKVYEVLPAGPVLQATTSKQAGETLVSHRLPKFLVPVNADLLIQQCMQVGATNVGIWRSTRSS